MPNCQKQLATWEMNPDPTCYIDPRRVRSFKGEYFCPFHLPVDYKNELDEAERLSLSVQIFTQMSDIISKVWVESKKGNRDLVCDFRGVIVPEEFFISRIVPKGMGLLNADFGSAIFMKNANFSGNNFGGTTIFVGAQFLGETSFSKIICDINSHIRFSEAVLCRLG